MDRLYNARLQQLESELKQDAERIPKMLEVEQRNMDLKQRGLKCLEDRLTFYTLQKDEKQIKWHENKIVSTKRQLKSLEKKQGKLKKELINCEKRVKISDFILSASSYLTKYAALEHAKLEMGICKQRKQELVNDFRITFFPEMESRKKKKRTTQLHCETCNLELVSSGSIYVCQGCGFVVNDYLGEGHLTYNQQQSSVTRKVPYCYKRLSHFQQLLSLIQGIEKKDIPDELIAMLKREFLRLRQFDPDNPFHFVRPIDVRRILREKGEEAYYDHCVLITRKINPSFRAIRLSKEVMHQLIQMFKQLEDVFHLVKTPKRKNFFSYPYVLRKFFELLDMDDEMQQMYLLKDSGLVINQDRMWKRACSILKWQFIKTV